MDNSKGEVNQGYQDTEGGPTYLKNISVPPIPRVTLSSDPRKSDDVVTSSTPNNVDGDGEEDSNEAGRQRWDRPIEFILSCVSMSVGLGNIWRFSFTAYKNGGGAFLIPYLIVLTFIGRPIYFMEMCMGQFSQFGTVKMWVMSPICKGVGFAAAFSSFCILTYYSSIMAQCIFYFFASFQKNLPWADCKPKWLEDICTVNTTLEDPCHDLACNPTNKTIAELYYDLDVFPKLDQIDDGLGSPDWRLSLCLLLSYILIFLSLWKGVKSSGKAAYFTAFFPYFVLIILLIRGATLKGAWIGIKFFIEPKWERMKDINVWYAAVGQCFFSLGLAGGQLVNFASFNPIKRNVYRDALIISLTDTFTSILAGCTIFAILGHLTIVTGSDIENVTGGGPGLAFVSYPEAIATFSPTPVPQLFAVLFFLMLIALAIGSAVALAGVIITVICDMFPHWNRALVGLGVCIVSFFIGLVYVTPGGPFMIDLVDYFGASFLLLLIAMLESMAVAWIYGLRNFAVDIEFMMGVKVGIYWKLCWFVICPVGLLVIFIYAMVKYEPMDMPTSAIVCGWIVGAFGILLVPAFAIVAIIRTRRNQTGGGGLFHTIFTASRYTAKWGPQNKKMRAEWMEFKKVKAAEWNAMPLWRKLL